MNNSNGNERRVLLVKWKRGRQGTEMFSSLKEFCRTHPGFDYNMLADKLEVGHKMFENDELRIERRTVKSVPKPDFAKWYFWEFRYDEMAWEAGYRTVIQRILERGMEKEWKELIRFYGKDKIIKTLKEEIKFLPDGILEEVADYFGLKKEEMRCYIWKQSRPRLWI
jgi:hypothetical protein